MASRLPLLLVALVLAVLIAWFATQRGTAHVRELAGLSPTQARGQAGDSRELEQPANVEAEPAAQLNSEPVANPASIESHASGSVSAPIESTTNDLASSPARRRVFTIAGELKTGLDGWSACFGVRFRCTPGTPGTDTEWSDVRTADWRGRFQFDGLPAGKYDFAVELCPHEGLVRELDAVDVGLGRNPPERMRVVIDVSESVHVLHVETVDDQGVLLAANGVVYSAPAGRDPCSMFALRDGRATILVHDARDLSVWAQGYLPSHATAVASDVKVALRASRTRIIVQLPCTAAEFPDIEHLSIQIRGGRDRPRSVMAVDSKRGCESAFFSEDRTRPLENLVEPWAAFSANGQAILIVSETASLTIRGDLRLAGPSDVRTLDLQPQGLAVVEGEDNLVTLNSILCHKLRRIADELRASTPR